MTNKPKNNHTEDNLAFAFQLTDDNDDDAAQNILMQRIKEEPSREFSKSFLETLCIYDAEQISKKQGLIAAIEFLQSRKHLDSGVIFENILLLREHAA